MKTGLSTLLLIVCGVICMASCNNAISYADMKKSQEKAIKRLISEKDFEILKDYPQDGVFGENQFVKLDNGIYLNVVDSGNGTRAKAGTIVIVRFNAVDFTNDDEYYSANFFDNSVQPLEFLYGSASYVVSQHSSSVDNYYVYFSAGMENILDYVGDGAVVKAIIPFEEGSSLQSSLGMAFYFDKMRFTFY